MWKKMVELKTLADGDSVELTLERSIWDDEEVTHEATVTSPFGVSGVVTVSVDDSLSVKLYEDDLACIVDHDRLERGYADIIEVKRQ